jgi:glycosyltransferase involved in cell wall biosynthesis
MSKVLFVATVVKKHIKVFHLPYLKWFKKNGYETHVCASNDYENKLDCEIPYCDNFFDLPFRRSPFNPNNIKVYKELKGIIDSNEYDIIHCHTPMGGVLTRLAAHNARSKGTKIIYTAHGFHFFKGAPLMNWLLYYPIERMLAGFTDVLITINKEDYLRASSSFKAKKVEYIPGVGIDTGRYSGQIVNDFEKRRELGIPKNAFAILSVGELNRNKNHEVIIKALAKIKDPNTFYMICGQGDYENYLTKLADSLGVKDRVIFLGFRNDLSEIYKVADMFAFPSYREGLSVSLMEAMASGLPVVCSNVRGNSDLIEDQKGGYLTEPNNIYEFAQKIIKLKNDKSLSKKLGYYNLNKVIIYDNKNVEKQMGRIYNKFFSKRDFMEKQQM